MIRGTDAMDTTVERPRRARLWLLSTLIALAALALLLAPTLSRWARAERTVDAARVHLATVVRTDLERDVGTSGRIVAGSFPRLFSPEPGIATLAVRAGEDVAAGDLLATVASPALEAELAQQRSALATAEGDLGRARIASRRESLAAEQAVALISVRRGAAARELERMQQLAAEGLANRVDLDRAADDLALADLELEHARASAGLAEETAAVEVRDRQLAVDRARLGLTELERRVARLEIRAPFAGRVATIEVQDRDAVAASQSLLTIVDLSRFEIAAAIPEAYADDVIAGTPAEVTWNGAVWPAEVATISPEVAGGQVEARLVFREPPPAGLRQNQRVPTRIVLERREDVLAVPRGAFLESGAGRRTYVVADSLATLREIETGATSVDAVEILAGLVEGETVVVSDLSLFGGARTVLLRD